MRAFVFAGACLAGADIYREDGPAFRGRSQEFARRHPTEPEHAGGFSGTKSNSADEEADRELGANLVSAAEQVPARSERQFTQHYGERRTSALDLLSEL